MQSLLPQGGQTVQKEVKNVNKYEILYIIDNDIDEEAKNQTVDKFKNQVLSLGGTVEEDGVDVWGTKKYAYPINYKTEGYYVLMNFQAAESVPAELERQLRNADAIVRFMIIRK